MNASGPADSGRQLPGFNSCTLCTFEFWEKAMSRSSFRSNYSFAPASHSNEPGPLSLFHSVLSYTILIPFYMYNRNISNLSPLHSSQSVIHTIWCGNLNPLLQAYGTSECHNSKFSSSSYRSKTLNAKTQNLKPGSMRVLRPWEHSIQDPSLMPGPRIRFVQYISRHVIKS